MSRQRARKRQSIAEKASNNPADGSRLPAVTVCLLVMFFAVAVHFGGTRSKAHFLDDNQFLLHNPLVKTPGWESAKRFLTEVWRPSSVEGYYQPLTMISLMFDYALGGRSVEPGVFRRTNLVLHALTCGLLTWLLCALFHRPVAALVCGALFAVHPANVEAVIWIAERKTMLAGFFALLSFNAYVAYARRPRRGTYAVCLGAFIAALLSKPIVVPLPLLFVLLDYWPMRRLAGWRQLVDSLKGKIPLFLAAALFAVVTFVSQSRAASTQLPSEWAVSHVPLVICHNILFYTRELFWPVMYWPFHPIPDPIDLSAPGMKAGVIGTLMLVAAIILAARRSKGVVFAASFFLVAILPTLGVIGFTVVIASDKYAYLPSIGVYIALAGLVVCLWDARSLVRFRMLLPILFVGFVGYCVVAVRRQHEAWQTDDSLYAHVLAMAPTAAIPRSNYGVLMFDRGRYQESIDLYREAIRIRPRYAEAHNNLGNALTAAGKPGEAFESFGKALEIWPDYPDAHVSLGYALFLANRTEKAIEHYHRALRIEPVNVLALNNLGNALLSQSRVADAVDAFERALAVDPTRADTYNNLAGARVRSGELDAAIQCYERAIAIQPRLLAAHVNMAETYRRMSRPESARERYRRALAIAEAAGHADAAKHILSRLESLDEVGP